MRGLSLGIALLPALLIGAMASAAPTPGTDAIQVPSAQNPTGDAAKNPADPTVPRNGVIHPPPDATADATVTPPNVDPKMTIPPPGTPGSDVKVIPK